VTKNLYSIIVINNIINQDLRFLQRQLDVIS
jgi:hypothetical protein